MSDALSSIGKALGGIFTKGNLGTILSGANVGLGEIGNLLAGRQQQNAARSVEDQMKFIQSMTPQQLTARVRAAEAPINQGLVQDVNNQVQADMAERGLAQAPGIFAATEEQALAPIFQANYNTALNQVMQQLGLPLSYAQTLAQLLPKGQNMTPAMMLFLQQLAKSRGAGGTVSLPPGINPQTPFPTPGPVGTYPNTPLTPPDLTNFGGVLGDTSVTPPSVWDTLSEAVG